MGVFEGEIISPSISFSSFLSLHRGEELGAGDVIGLVPPGEAELVEVFVELFLLFGGDFETAGHAAVFRAVVAVVEQGHVEVRAEGLEELEQGACAFRELEGQDAFVLHGGRGLAAYHVAHMALGEGIAGHVRDGVAGGAQVFDDLFQLFHAAGEAQRGEDLGLLGVGNAVVEFRHHALAQLLAQGKERAGLFRNGHGNDAFAAFTNFTAFGNEAQGVEVHVRAGKDAGHARALYVVLGGVLLETGKGERARRFGNGAGVVKDILERGADLVVGAGDDLVEVLAEHAEGLVADAAHGHTVGKQGYAVERDGFTGFPGGLKAGRALGFHADDLHFGEHLLDVNGHTSGEAATAHLHENVGEAAVLLEQFAGHSTLAGNDVGVIVGRDKGQAFFLGKTLGFGVGLIDFPFLSVAPIL